MRLVWSVLAVALAGALVVVSAAASEALVAGRAAGDAGYARRLAASALSECLAQEYGPAYDLSGVSNLRGWSLEVEVAYYGPGLSPAFDPGYPDSGLQRLTATVRDPRGIERARACTLKAR
ncbi:MAG: hypothetical protein AB1609_19835 [Bacillota bacterium]